MNVNDERKWPKKTKLYLHGGSSENMWRRGEELGLSEEACGNNFMGALYEVTFEVLVYEDGSYEILKVYEVEDKPFIRGY